MRRAIVETSQCTRISRPWNQADAAPCGPAGAVESPFVAADRGEPPSARNASHGHEASFPRRDGYEINL
jgi:hypothetical protein